MSRPLSLRVLWLALVLALPSAMAGLTAIPVSGQTSDNVGMYGAGWHLDADGNGIDDRLDDTLAAGQRTEVVALHVHYARPTTDRDLAFYAAKLGVEGARRFVNWDDVEVEVPVGLVPLIRKAPGVLSVERIEIPELLNAVARKATLVEAVAGIPVQDGINHAYGADTMFGLRGDGMVIAILDTGVNTLHAMLDDLDDDPTTDDPKLVQKMVGDRTVYAAFDTTGLVRGCNAPNVDDEGHGTHVAGTALGTRATNNEGVAPRAKLVDIDISVGGRGTGYTTGLDYVLRFNAGTTCYGDPGEDRIDVASLSFTGDPDPRSSMSRKLTDVARSGVTFVMAAGNSGSGPRTLTTGAEGVIVVANSVDQGTVTRTDDVIAGSSSRGPRTSDADADTFDELQPHIAAPGSSITSASNINPTGTSTKTGTSMSTPHIAGIAALILQANPALRPVDLHSNEAMGNPGAVPVRDILIQSAQAKGAAEPTTQVGNFGRSWNAAWGYGLVDASAAITFAWQSAGRGTDVVIEDIKKPATIALGDDVVFTVVVRNHGLASVPASRVTASLDGIGLLDATVPALVPGESALMATASWTATPGLHALTATIDVDNAIVESDEANNVHVMLVATRETLHSQTVDITGRPEVGTMTFTTTEDYGNVHIIVLCKFTAATAGFVNVDAGATVYPCASNQRVPVVDPIRLEAGTHTLWYTGLATSPFTIEVVGERV